MRNLSAAFAAFLICSAAASAETVETSFVGGTGDTIGTATLTPSPHGVLIRVEIAAEGLEPGWHGMHLHEVGDCSDVGEFQLSGGMSIRKAASTACSIPKGPTRAICPTSMPARTAPPMQKCSPG